MDGLIQEIRGFQARKTHAEEASRLRVALQLVAGIDIEEKMYRDGDPALVARIARLIERERLRGLRRHSSYDLNRHIALKQALEGIWEAHGPARRAVKPSVARNAKRRPKAP
ncbi:cytoplasmic protein [Mesorhizobium sp. NBSH29]|uniref:cytoplasmic protein n=1 Tax=Mesorhizobium sp. NBSH29 TaxID=2654249 RepID=UPI0018964AC4|nr:cytoplasmic protein [Mesorhizobium sp. NBSH29]QPC87185.1 cytoplasmic protein [Mesorhizobium sp. NBSH29]